MPKDLDSISLAHTCWNRKYLIVFIPKYRRKAIYTKLRADILSYTRRLCAYRGVEVVEVHAMPGHIHMFVKIPLDRGDLYLAKREYNIHQFWQHS